MSRLFIFAIGGTGSRVVKSLAMLLASGVKINAREIIPIIIDPDSTNGDMQRTVDILKHYRRINKKIETAPNNDLIRDSRAPFHDSITIYGTTALNQTASTDASGSGSGQKIQFVGPMRRVGNDSQQ